MNCSEKMMKYFMIIINAFFVLIGIGLIVVGGLSLTTAGSYQHMLEDGFFSLPALLLTMGLFVTVLFFFGCWGLKKESYCFMITFSVLLGIILAMELIGGISAYVLRDRTLNIFQNTIEQSFNATYNPLNNDSSTYRNESRVMWDNIQADGHCCGLNNYTDYYHLPINGTWDPNSNVSATIPFSCCNATSTTGSCDVTKPYELYQTGCGEIIQTTVVDAIGMVAKWGVLVAVLHLLWILGACYFAQVFRRQSYESV